MLKLLIALGVVFLILAGVIYFLFFAKIFDVRTVEIEGAETVAGGEIEQVINNWLDGRRLGVKRRSNSFVFSVKKISPLLANQFLKIDSAEVSKKSAHEIEVSVTERKPMGLWCLSKPGVCYYFDKNGVAYAETGSSEGFILTLVRDDRERQIKLGELVAPPAWIGNIDTARELLKKGGLDISGFIIPADALDGFDAKTSFGWPILFSHSTDVGKQISALFDVLKSKIPADQLLKLEYIDLRIQDRVYYK